MNIGSFVRAQIQKDNKSTFDIIGVVTDIIYDGDNDDLVFISFVYDVYKYLKGYVGYVRDLDGCIQCVYIISDGLSRGCQLEECSKEYVLNYISEKESIFWLI